MCTTICIHFYRILKLNLFILVYVQQFASTLVYFFSLVQDLFCFSMSEFINSILANFGLSNSMRHVATEKQMETVKHSPKREAENDTYGRKRKNDKRKHVTS